MTPSASHLSPTPYPANPHPAMLDQAALLAECQMQTTRRSGPGGQHRNKVETAVIFTHLPTGLSAEANEKRSQAANRKQALHRLRVRLAIEVRSPIDKRAVATGVDPSPLWKSRVHAGRLAINPTHADFPALLAEALDQLAAKDFDPALAATCLGVSTTQLIKLLRLAPAALRNLNTQRQAKGLRALK